MKEAKDHPQNFSISKSSSAQGRSNFKHIVIQFLKTGLTNFWKSKSWIFERANLMISYADGDIITNKLSIEPGAAFTGSCSMGAVIKDIKDAGKKEQKEKTA